MHDRGKTQAPALTHLAVAGYRSLQQLILPLGVLPLGVLPLGGLPLGGLTLVCGANGSGKSNLYRSLGLITAAARGDLVAALAAEGGLPAVFWAGPERTTREMRRGEKPVQGSSGRREATRLRLGIACETLSYAIELGYRADDQTSAFVLDPEIKREWIWAGGPFHPRSLLVQRTGAVVERWGKVGPTAPWPWRCRPTRVCSPLSPIHSKRRKCSSCATPSSAGASTTASAPIARPRPAAAASPPARLLWPATAATWQRRCRRSWRSAMRMPFRRPLPMHSPPAA